MPDARRDEEGVPKARRGGTTPQASAAPPEPLRCRGASRRSSVSFVVADTTSIASSSLLALEAKRLPAQPSPVIGIGS